VRVRSGEGLLDEGRQRTGIAWQGQPPTTDYEISLEAQQRSEKGEICGLTIPVGSTWCEVVVGLLNGRLLGLGSIDGKKSHENLTTTSITVEAGRWHRIRARVTADRVQVWLNERQVIDFPRAGHTVELPDYLDSLRPLGISTNRTAFSVRNIRLRCLKSETARGKYIDIGLGTDVAHYDADRRGLVIGRVTAPSSPLAPFQDHLLTAVNGRDLVGMTADELTAHFRDKQIVAGDVLRFQSRGGALLVTLWGRTPEAMDFKVLDVRTKNITDRSFDAELTLYFRQAGDYRVTDAAGKVLIDWAPLRSDATPLFAVASVPRTASDAYELYVERRMGGQIRRFQVPFSLRGDARAVLPAAEPLRPVAEPKDQLRKPERPPAEPKNQLKNYNRDYKPVPAQSDAAKGKPSLGQTDAFRVEPAEVQAVVHELIPINVTTGDPAPIEGTTSDAKVVEVWSMEAPHAGYEVRLAARGTGKADVTLLRAGSRRSFMWPSQTTVLRSWSSTRPSGN